MVNIKTNSNHLNIRKCDVQKSSSTSSKRSGGGGGGKDVKGHPIYPYNAEIFLYKWKGFFNFISSFMS